MFVVDIKYVKSLTEVDTHLDAHRHYLAANYANGTFILSGPKEPRTGGIIVASASSREQLLVILAGDPFQIHAVAEYEVTEFQARATADGLEQLVASLREADALWSFRTRDAQITTATFSQSQSVANIGWRHRPDEKDRLEGSLAEQHAAAVAEYAGKDIKRPE